MHIRLRLTGKPDTIIVVESKLTKIQQFRSIIKEKLDVDENLQRLFYGGKLLEDGYTFHDYNIKLNDVIQLMVKVQPPEDTSCRQKEKKELQDNEYDKKKVAYKDAISSLYEIGDLIDAREKEQGCWYEAKIEGIVYDPDLPPKPTEENSQSDNDSDSENLPPSKEEKTESKNKGIAYFFNKKKKDVKNNNNDHSKDDNLLFKVKFDEDEENSAVYLKVNDIRPRARQVIDIKDLKVGQKVMINYNTDNPNEKGLWYDFKVDEIKKNRNSFELNGTLYLGADGIPQNDTKVKVLDKIFAIEEVVPLALRSKEDKEKMMTPSEKRSAPLNCLTCRDDEDTTCRDCGCYLCLGKEYPEKIVLCDECNKGYHMNCLDPPLTEVPDDDWYCPSCKRDPNDVVAPGAAKQTKKYSKTSKDWGRGMACAGKTKTCAMPTNHFGPIPGIEVGMRWRFRIQLSESGVHRPPVSGIHGRDVEGAYSIVLSGGYEDDYDNGHEFTYTGSGGRDLSGNKRTAEQSCDQTLTRENKGLARNCAVKVISEEGGDAGDEWRKGKPVRVVRSYKMMKHFPKYAPSEGIRYDGIYKVVKYYPEKGLSGYRVWKYLLRRDDSSPAPWEPNAKQYPLIYPDGYLEAEAEKKALKEKKNKPAKDKGNRKRMLRESNTSESEVGDSPPGKKKKTEEEPAAKKGKHTKKKTNQNTTKTKVVPTIFSNASSKSNTTLTPNHGESINAADLEIIKADELNSKLWNECIEVCETKGKKEFVEHVTQVFLCIICQEVAVTPVTTPCLHNFCMACMKLAFKSTGAQTCPCCRQSLAKFDLQPNEQLKAALRAILAGYDAGKK